jgi:hypothetical protein
MRFGIPPSWDGTSYLTGEENRRRERGEMPERIPTYEKSK